MEGKSASTKKTNCLSLIIEVSGYVLFAAFVVSGKVNYPFALLFFTAAVILGIILSIMTLLLEEFSRQRYPKLKDIFIITFASIAENFIYRQFLSLVRTKAFFDLVKGKTSWRDIKKKGFNRRD
ncbi:MAG: hypothetical protein R6V00_08490 [Candidatus Aminicenantes bacterium]